MPRAYHVKHHYLDHDTDQQSLSPPILNQWYTVFEAHDVRLLWCVTRQKNDESAAKNLEVRWTIDGNVYRSAASHVHDTVYYWYRGHLPSAVGTAGLYSTTTSSTAGKYTDKRGIDFKVEVRITSALGTNQTFDCWCVRETLERT